MSLTEEERNSQQHEAARDEQSSNNNNNNQEDKEATAKQKPDEGEKPSAQEEKPAVEEPEIKKSLFEKESYYNKSSWWDRLFLTWTFPLVRRTKTEKLTVDDFGGIDQQESIDVQLQALTKLYEEQPEGQKNVMLALAKTFQWDFLRFYCIEIFQSCLRLSEPLCVQKMVAFLNDDGGDRTYGMKLLGTMIFIQFLDAMIGHQMAFYNHQLGHRAYRTMNCLVYNKQLKLSPSTSKNFSHGEINHYASGAVGMIVHMCFDAINVARLPIYFVYCVYSLVNLLGFTLLTAVFLMYFQMYFGHWIHSRNRRMDHKLHKIREKRMKYTSESIYNAKTLKFYNWNEKFEEEINGWRSKEIKLRWKLHYRNLVNHVVSSFLPRIMNPLVFASFFYFGGQMDLAQSMHIMHLLGMLQGQLHHFPHIQRMWAHLRIQIVVLQRYLGCKEVAYDVLIQQDKKDGEINSENEYAVKIDNHSFSWGIRTRNDEEEWLERKRMERDERRSAWLVTRLVNKTGRAVDRAIKDAQNVMKKAKAPLVCKCAKTCYKNGCRCEEKCTHANVEAQVEEVKEKVETKAVQNKDKSDFKQTETQESTENEDEKSTSNKSSKSSEQSNTQDKETDADKKEEEKDDDKTEQQKEKEKKEQEQAKAMKCRCKGSQCFKKDCKKATPCRFIQNTESHSTLDQIVTLKNIDLKIKRGEFTCIIGECGSGKSSLLSTIIGDLTYVDPDVIDKYGKSKRGLEKQFEQRAELKEFANELVDGVYKLFKPPIQLNGDLAYVQQTPWIQNMTIRDNICYGTPLDKCRYYDTIKMCELERDFEILPAGDLTEIGERGINLSGGQKARISLARAVYSNKDIFLMDDPISALDAEVRKNIFRNLIFGHLKQRTCILVTHAIDFLYMADKVVIMEKGKIVSQGTYKEVKANEILKKLLEVNNLNKNKVTEKLNKDGNVVQQEASDQDYDSGDEQEEEDADLSKDESMNPSYTASDLTDEEKTKRFEGLGRVSEANDGKIIKDEDSMSIEVGWDTYKSLFKLFGGLYNIFCAACISGLLIYFRIQVEYAIGQWTSDYELQRTKYGQFILVVGQFTIQILFAEAFKSVLMMLLNMRAATDMHDNMIKRIIRAPQNLFFDTHPNSVIMKRLTEDLGTLEHNMADEFVNVLGNLQNMVSVICVVYLANWKILCIFPLMVAVSSSLYYFMMPAHKTICHILGVTDHPINNHRNESIQGNSTIRAFKKEGQFISKNTELVDKNTLAHKTSIAIWVWFGLANAMNVLCISALSIITMIFFKTPNSDAIWKAMTLNKVWELHGGLWGLLHQSGSIDRRMVQVLKCFQILEIPQEKSKEEAKTILTEEQLKNWPSKGDISFKGVEMRYRPKCDLVLKGCDFEIKGGQKVGIVGRTGAGKSTIINCISRICEIEGGSMEIDGVNISDIPVSQLRDVVTVIPQDPTLFSGSVRFNVDPTGQASDKDILALLEKAGLKKLLNREKTSKEDSRGKGRKQKKRLRDFSDSEVSSSSDEDSEAEREREKEEKELEGEVHGPLDMSVSEGGDNLSSGEKQLLCICRAIIRKRKIIVLDEATANIDLITEQKIQSLMKSEFKDQTMIVIAHRLQTIIESDRVMVLGDGKVMEMDAPAKLLENEKSHFTKLVNQLKKKTAQREDEEKKKKEREEQEKKKKEEEEK